MKKLVIGLLLSVVSVSTFADTPTFKTLTDEKATFDLCQNYADTLNKNLLSNGNPKPAFDIIRPYAVIPQVEIDSLEHNSAQIIKRLNHLIGAYVKTEHIDSKKFANDNFIQHQFLAKRELNAWYISCTFYKPKDKWQLHTFNFYDNPFLLKN